MFLQPAKGIAPAGLPLPPSYSLGKRILLAVAKTAAYGLLSVLLAVPFFLAAGQIAGAEAMQALQSPDLGRVDPRVLAGIWLGLLAGSVGATWFFRRVVDRQPVATAGWRLPGAAPDFGKGALLGITLITLGFLSLFLLGRIDMQGLDFRGQTLLAWVIFFLFQTTYEEVVFRGYLLRMLAEYFKPLAALLVTSALFGILHAPNDNFSPIGLINILLAGLLLGALVLRTGRIWAAVGLHFTWNLFQSVIFGFPVSGLTTYRLLRIEVEGPAWLSGGPFGLEGSLLMTLLLGACLWPQRRIFTTASPA